MFTFSLEAPDIGKDQVFRQLKMSILHTNMAIQGLYGSLNLDLTRPRNLCETVSEQRFRLFFESGITGAFFQYSGYLSLWFKRTVTDTLSLPVMV